MSYLWCGGEDIDFPNGNVTYGPNGSSGFRTGYARCGLGVGTGIGMAYSTPFQGGAVTAGWLSCQCILLVGVNTSQQRIGFGTGTAGIMIGSSSSSANKLAIWGWNGSTFTQLAIEPGTSINTHTQFKFDVHFTGLGSSPSVSVYIGGNLMLTYSGTVPISNASCVMLGAVNVSDIWTVSEIIVADADTRAVQGLVTMAPSGNGTTQNWSNPAFTNFSPVVINDANSAFVNTTGQDEQATLSDMPSGNFSIPLVKIAARALATTGAASTNLKLGVNNGGTVAVGSSLALSTAFNTVENYDTTDPTTGSAWVLSQMNGMQLDMRSA